MRTLFYIVCGLTCVVLITAAMYDALKIGIGVYIAYANQDRMQQFADQRRAFDDQLLRQSIANTGKGSSPDSLKQHDQDELSGKLPSLFVDPENYKIEDNWLASQVSREIAEMLFFAARPGTPLPDLKVRAVVDPRAPSVHVVIDGWSTGTATSDLVPAFAWDPDGYAPLVRQLNGTAVSESTPLNQDLLGDLLDPNGAKLAEEDVKLSADLQMHPASWQDHEAAALLLMALALRNEESLFVDNRPLLTKATAHLALAQAWRGDAHTTWPGLIADAALRTLAGREIDALAHLDQISKQPTLPESAKPWIAALRIRTTENWRMANVTTKSPLLLKLAWFRMLLRDTSEDFALARLSEVLPQTEPDPTLPPDQQKTDPDTLVPDWCRINGISPFDDNGDPVKSAQYRLDLEFHEVDEISKAEGSTPFDLEHLAKIFSEKTSDTVSVNDLDQVQIRVIGAGNFKAIGLGHIYDGLIGNDVARDTNQDSAKATVLFDKMENLFQGVPGYEIVRLQKGFIGSDAIRKQFADWLSAKKVWRVYEGDEGLYAGMGMPGEALVKQFYKNVVPFGTAYAMDFGHRFGEARSFDPYPFTPFDTPELEKLKKLPPLEALKAINDYSQKVREKEIAIAPRGPQPFERELLKLDPDNYLLAVDYVPDEMLFSTARRFFNYNFNPMYRIEKLDAAHLSDADRLMVLRKHVAVDPNFGFRAAIFVRSKGLDDEAADMERKAFAANDNPIATSNEVLPLVDYDLRHGRNDEAMKVAQFAGQVNSEMGLSILTFALEKLGRLDEAETAARQDATEYSDPTWLTYFQLRHPDRYPLVYAAELNAHFPSGLLHAKIGDFVSAPESGAVITSASDALAAANLTPGDVIVALDGYRVDSEAQYMFIRALSMDSKMNFIIWRKDKYLEQPAVVPSRRMMVEIVDFTAK